MHVPPLFLKLTRGTAALGRECGGRYHAARGAWMKIVLIHARSEAASRGKPPRALRRTAQDPSTAV
jgi:hypothetical protein